MGASPSKNRCDFQIYTSSSDNSEEFVTDKTVVNSELSWSN